MKICQQTLLLFSLYVSEYMTARLIEIKRLRVFIKVQKTKRLQWKLLLIESVKTVFIIL